MDEVALTGMKFFNLTRSVVISVFIDGKILQYHHIVQYLPNFIRLRAQLLPTNWFYCNLTRRTRLMTAMSTESYRTANCSSVCKCHVAPLIIDKCKTTGVFFLNGRTRHMPNDAFVIPSSWASDSCRLSALPEWGSCQSWVASSDTGRGSRSRRCCVNWTCCMRGS